MLIADIANTGRQSDLVVGRLFFKVFLLFEKVKFNSGHVEFEGPLSYACGGDNLEFVYIVMYNGLQIYRSLTY